MIDMKCERCRIKSASLLMLDKDTDMPKQNVCFECADKIKAEDKDAKFRPVLF